MEEQAKKEPHCCQTYQSSFFPPSAPSLAWIIYGLGLLICEDFFSSKLWLREFRFNCVDKNWVSFIQVRYVLLFNQSLTLDQHVECLMCFFSLSNSNVSPTGFILVIYVKAKLLIVCAILLINHCPAAATSLLVQFLSHIFQVLFGLWMQVVIVNFS